MNSLGDRSEIDADLLQELAQTLADTLGQSIETMTEEEIQAYLELLLSETEGSTEYGCAHTAFERQAHASPDAIALIVDDGPGGRAEQALPPWPLRSRQQRISYAELNHRANQVARYLQRRGLILETPVAVCMERSVELVVALLAILKAGATYLPLAPDDPPLHVERVIAAAQPRLGLTQQRLAARWPAQDLEVICIDTEWPHIAREAGTDDVASVGPAAPAYIVFSSGRALAVEQRSLVHNIQRLQEAFALSARDRLLPASTVTLDVAIWELLWPLTCGASVVIAAPREYTPVDLLRTIVAQQISLLHLTPAALSGLLGADEAQGGLLDADGALRQVLCSGGPLRRAVAERFAPRSKAKLCYLYGPPEAAAAVTLQPCETRVAQAQVPIGQPGTDLSVYVLDGYLQPVPTGVVGEICIAGEPLARGYLHDPDATAWRIVANPFTLSAHGRMLRTGDRGRRLNDGTFELIASAAGQAWVEGFCVDLDWLAGQLLVDPAIEHCVVLARETADGAPQLVAYVVLAGPVGETDVLGWARALLPHQLVPGAVVLLADLPRTAAGQIDERALLSVPVIDAALLDRWEAELRRTLKTEQVAVVVRNEAAPIAVPDLDEPRARPCQIDGHNPPLQRHGDMVAVRPESLAAFVTGQPDADALAEVAAVRITDRFGTPAPCALIQIDEMPRDDQEAIDRHCLGTTGHGRQLVVDHVAPRTEQERRLVAIWQEVLGVQQIGIHDKFLELGGDSVLAIQMIARAEQLGVRLTAEQVFRYQNVAQLARVSGAARVVHAEQGLVTGDVPLTPAQHSFFEHHLPVPDHFNHAYLFEAREPVDLAQLEHVMHRLVVHHDALRLRFVRTAAGWRQSIAPAERHVLCSTIDLARLPEAEQWPALEARATDLQASLNLADGPLLRVLVAERGAQRLPFVLIIIHHLVVDGFSWRILLEDLQTAYTQVSRGEPIQLPPKTTSFKYWAERLAAYAQTAEARADLAYWLEQTWPRDAGIPLDMAGANREQSACNVSLNLSPAETHALLARVPRAYKVQVIDAMLTALAQSFAGWTGERRLLVEIAHHGRKELFDDVDLSRTVGWFSTFYPVVLDLGAVADPRAELQTIKQQLEQVPQQGFNFLLQRHLCGDAQIAARMQALPRPRVLLTYLGQFDQVFSETALLKLVASSVGSIHHPEGTRMYQLVFNQLVAADQLGLGLTYSDELHQRSSVEWLAQGYLDALRTLIGRSEGR